MNRMIISLFGMLVACSQFLCAANPNVYRVLADDTKLTGFRLMGERGIVTALHGVVGRSNIRAISAADNNALIGLQIVAVDVAHDMALLSNQKLDEDRQLRGLNVAADPQWKAGDELIVIGFPKEVTFEELRTRMELREPPRKPLKTIVGPQKLAKLTERGSPHPSLSVVSIQGEMLPGHSGAPVVDSLQRLVAVGNGGLRDEISWAIPWSDVEWRPVETIDSEMLARLSRHSDLFSNIRILGSPITLTQVEDKDGSTTAKASGKVSWLPGGNGIRVDVHLYVRKSGVTGKGYAFARVDLLDAGGNTVWSSSVFRKHKGASLSGVAKAEDDFSATAPSRLRDDVASAVLIVRAEDDDGFTSSLAEFFERAGGDIEKALREGQGLPSFEKLFPL